MARPSRVRATSAKRIVCAGPSRCRSWATSPSHGTAATAATSAQEASPARQPPKASATGTVRVIAAVSPTASAVV